MVSRRQAEPGAFDRVQLRRHAILAPLRRLIGATTAAALAGNGNDCATYGYKVVAGACAQMPWPIPDSCTYAYVEYHRP